MAILSGLSDKLNQLKSNAENFIGQQTGLVQAKNTKSAITLPWNDSKNRFWAPIQIDPERWDQLFPYRLLVIDASTNAPIGGSRGNPTVSIKGDKFGTTIDFVPVGSQWVFRLPITPQQLSIVDQFAINTTATLRGVTEEHNGVKFKMISAAGTMGIWPHRPSVTNPPSSPSALSTLFGGTIESANNLANQFTRVINSATSNHPANPPKTISPLESSAGSTSTGYYQAMALQQFFEQYAEAKKDPKNKNWRLVFDIPKQNQAFVVTPLQFAWQQSEQNPNRISYNFQLKAWRRVTLGQTSPQKPSITPLSTNTLQKILSTITEARKLLSNYIDLVAAVRSDVTKPLDVLRQSSLFVKDLVGAIVTTADLPFQIQRDYDSSIKESLKILSSSIAQTSADSSLRMSLKSVTDSLSATEGLSMKAISGGQLGKNASFSQTTDPANNIFSKPEANFSLMDSVPSSSLSLSPAQQESIDNAIDLARQITVDDIKGFRSTILELALQLSNNFGAGDSYFSQIYNKPSPKNRVTDMTLQEYELLNSLYSVIESYDVMTATTEIDDSNKQSNMEYVAGLAENADIDFSVPNSKILVPVPFGLSIEQISARYLGDPQRWIEIVTLNNLRSPYIDENGFQRSLLSNASGRQITINSNEDMYVGQRIVLRSSTQPFTARRVLSIDRLSDTSFLLSLDGEPDLDIYTIADNAYIQAYLPGTVNSQQKIFIPNDAAVPDSPNIIVPPSVSQDPLVGLSNVDWLLTETGDLAINSYGDFRFSAGMTNLIQAIKIKLSTQKGTVLLHPDFGIGVKAGISNADVDVQDIFNSISKMIEDDPRFQGLDSLQISLKGPVLTISMGVILAGESGVFPITFDLAN